MDKWTAYDSPNGVDYAPLIQKQLDQLRAHGGRLQLANHAYGIWQPVEVNSSSSCLCGEAWACNTDPNGVFETDHGTKLRMHGRDFPALTIGRAGMCVSGACVRDLGIQGDIKGMDTRWLVDYARPERAAGLYLGDGRMDQCTFSGLAFCGCSSGVCADGHAEIDACLFEKLNVDGCGNGFYFAPEASFYTRVRSCIVADNPYYGFVARTTTGKMHNLIISECTFVRNGGAFTDGDGMIPAAVLLDRVNDCEVSRCLFDAPGTYWHYPEDAVKNNQRIISKRRTTALHVTGDRNRLTGNTFLHCPADAVCIEGDGNILMGNISAGSVRIRGTGNCVMQLAFTRSDARLILQGDAADTTIISGVDTGRIVRQK